MLETKREERNRSVLGEGYFVDTWDIPIHLKSTGKSWLYGSDLYSLHHRISLHGDMGQEKNRNLDLCYLVLLHILYPILHNFQCQPCCLRGLCLSIFLIWGIKCRYWCLFHFLPWGQDKALLHLLNSSLHANHIYMTANLYNFPMSIYSVVPLSGKSSPSGPCQRAQ